MAPEHHPIPLSGGNSKALAKEFGSIRAMIVMAQRTRRTRSRLETRERLIAAVERA
jgi:hypothetical protein